MAAKTASLSVNIIADAAKAKAGFNDAGKAANSFGDQIKNADGAVNKFKVGSGAALDFVKNNAMNFASAAGAAVVAFGVKSVMAFQDLALSAGKFSDATGLAVEDASRLIEVAGDIGVEAASVEKAVGFMNKALGKSPELFKNLGVEIKYAADGTTDVNATFLEVVDRLNQIKDPAERAAAAASLLGKGWMDMSELITGGSDALAASLAEVSDAKVIDQKEVEKARQFRASMDSLNDAFEDISLTLGQTLVPALAEALSGLAAFVEKAKEVGNFEAFGVSIGDAAKFAFKLGFSAVTAGQAIYSLGKDLFGASDDADDAADSLDKAGVATEKITGAWNSAQNTFFDGRFVSQNLINVWRKGYVELVAAGDASENLKNTWVKGHGTFVESEKVSKDLASAWRQGEPAFIRSKESSDFLINAWREGYQALRKADSITVDLKDSWHESSIAFTNGRTASDELAASVSKMGAQALVSSTFVDGLSAEWQSFLGLLDKRDAFENAQAAIADYEETFKKAAAGNKQAQEEVNDKLRQGQREIARAMEMADLIPGSQAKQILFLTETGQLQEALSLLKTVDSWYMRVQDRAKITPSGMGSGRLPGMASGGTVTTSGFVVVGERGPELLHLPGGASVSPEIPNDIFMPASIPARVGGGGGTTVINVNVDAGLVSSPDQVGQQIIEAIRRAERRSGQVFVAA